MFNMTLKYVLPLRLLVLLALSVAAVATVEAVPPKPSSSTATKTTIDSEKMTVRNKEHQAVFEGKVVLTKANLIVRSDKMVVFYEPKPQQTSGATATQGSQNGESQTGNLSVRKIEATGRVLIEKNAGRMSCHKAVYYKHEEKVVCTGNPVAWEKGNRVTGKRITMFLVEDRTIVDGGSRLLLD